MKRWRPVLVIPILVLITAGACDPPPPAGWQPPDVESITITPEPVIAGAPFTISAVVSDDEQVARVHLKVLDPRGQESPVLDCEVPELDPQPIVLVEIPCTLPDFALNGTWELVINAYDGEWAAGHGGGAGWARATFEVAGGSNDAAAPVLESATIEPATPVVGEPFTVVVRASDENLVVPPHAGTLRSYKVGAPRPPYWVCDVTSVQLLSPTLQESTFVCPGAAELGAGPYWLQFVLADANGNRDGARVDFDKVAAP
jgi:hypothetical protein